MRAIYKILVDGLYFLPQVFCERGEQRGAGIDVPRDFENARPQRRENCLHGSDDAVIEGVYSAGSLRFADAARDEQLDVPCLDLDVHDCSIAHDIERFGERRNARPVCKRELFEVCCRQLGDRFSRGSLRVPCVHYRIVVHDDDAVQRCVHIELYPARAQLDGALECGKGVLWMGLVRAPVSDPLGRVVASTCRQAFLRVVALCSMNAKL